MLGKYIYVSQHILDSSSEEVDNHGLDFTGDKEEDADNLDLSDNELEEELAEGVDN